MNSKESQSSNRTIRRQTNSCRSVNLRTGQICGNVTSLQIIQSAECKQVYRGMSWDSCQLTVQLTSIFLTHRLHRLSLIQWMTVPMSAAAVPSHCNQHTCNINNNHKYTHLIITAVLFSTRKYSWPRWHWNASCRRHHWWRLDITGNIRSRWRWRGVRKPHCGTNKRARLAVSCSGRRTGRNVIVIDARSCHQTIRVRIQNCRNGARLYQFWPRGGGSRWSTSRQRYVEVVRVRVRAGVRSAVFVRASTTRRTVSRHPGVRRQVVKAAALRIRPPHLRRVVDVEIVARSFRCRNEPTARRRRLSLDAVHVAERRSIQRHRGRSRFGGKHGQWRLRARLNVNFWRVEVLRWQRDGRI